MQVSLPGNPRPTALLASRAALMLLALLLALVSVACGDDDSSPPVDAEALPFRDVGVNKEAAALVPLSIREIGTLQVPTATSYPPNEFIASDGSTIIGMDPDMARAIGQRLGLELRMKALPFDSILKRVADSEYELAMSSFSITPPRLRSVNMVSYFEAGTGFFSIQEPNATLSGLAGLCGRSVAVSKESVQFQDATRQSSRCRRSGQQPVKITTFVRQDDATESVESGESEFGMADTPVVSYIVSRSGGKLTKVGEDYGLTPYGVAINRDSGLAVPVRAAIESLIADGTYAEILARWGLEDGAVKSSTISR